MITMCLPGNGPGRRTNAKAEGESVLGCSRDRTGPDGRSRSNERRVIGMLAEKICPCGTLQPR